MKQQRAPSSSRATTEAAPSPELQTWQSNLARNEALAAGGPVQEEGSLLLDDEAEVGRPGEKRYGDIATPIRGSSYIAGGRVDIPYLANDGFVQQYSGLGIPITEDAWKRQDDIDGGKLRTCYAGALKETLSTANPELLRLVPRRVMELVETDAVAREQFLRIVKESPAFEAWATSQVTMDQVKLSQAIQEGTLDRYLAMAARDEGAEFILELMPTETDDRANANGGLGTGGALLGQPNEHDDFRVGPMVGGFRAGTAAIAETLDTRTDDEKDRGVPNNVYALPVPYGNTPEQAIEGHPKVGTVENYVRKIDRAGTESSFGLPKGVQRPNITLSGYSQGGRAALDYVGSDMNQGRGHVDRCLAMAPMGGTTPWAGCEEGVWGGKLNGTRTVAIEHEDDPARFVSPNNEEVRSNKRVGSWTAQLSPTLAGAANFSAPENAFGKTGYNVLHGEPFRDGKTGPPFTNESGEPAPALKGNPVFEKGTYGYPAEGVMTYIDALLEGDRRFDGPYERQGPWTADQLPDGYKEAIDRSRVRVTSR